MENNTTPTGTIAAPQPVQHIGSISRKPIRKKRKVLRKTVEIRLRVSYEQYTKLFEHTIPGERIDEAAKRFLSDVIDSLDSGKDSRLKASGSVDGFSAAVTAIVSEGDKREIAVASIIARLREEWMPKGYNVSRMERVIPDILKRAGWHKERRAIAGVRRVVWLAPYEWKDREGER